MIITYLTNKLEFDSIKSPQMIEGLRSGWGRTTDQGFKILGNKTYQVYEHTPLGERVKVAWASLTIILIPILVYHSYKGSLNNFLGIKSTRYFVDVQMKESLNIGFLDNYGFFRKPQEAFDIMKPSDFTIQVKKRQTEIDLQKEVFLKKIDRENVLLQKVESCSYAAPVGSGTSGVYFFGNSADKPLYVVKPSDEASLSLHNPKGNATFFESHREHLDIASDQSAINAALAYDVAVIIGVSDITPKTTLAVLSSNEFHFNHTVGNKDKLCSVQEFVGGAKPVLDYMIKNPELETIDLESLEMGNILKWVSGNQDANASNHLVDKNGKMILIDNDNTFGDGLPNCPIKNEIMILNGIEKTPLSDKGKKIIKDIDIAKIVSKMRFYGKSQKSIDSLVERVYKLKALAKLDTITLKEIDKEMHQASVKGWLPEITPVEALA